MSRWVPLLPRSIHVHVRWCWHVRTVRVRPIIRWGCRRRGRMWGRHKHRTGIVCQYGRGGVILTVCQRSRCWPIPHVIYICAAAGKLIWGRTWFLLFKFGRRNCSRRWFLFEFSFIFRGFVQLPTFGSSVFEPNLNRWKKNTIVTLSLITMHMETNSKILPCVTD